MYDIEIIYLISYYKNNIFILRFKCSALTGFGLNEGMEWIANILKDK